jgi:hypothetical protein
MPTNRTRIKRAVRSRVTDEAREIFADAIKLQDIYHDCISNKDNCRSTAVNRHCPDCARYIKLSQELGSLLGTKPWETSPLDTDTETPPDWMRNDSQLYESWRKAWALRCELDRGAR